MNPRPLMAEEKLLSRLEKSWRFSIPLKELIRVERSLSKSGRKRIIYIFKCADNSCDKEIRIWNTKSRIGAKCQSCLHKKRPYEHIYNKLLTAAKKNKCVDNSLTFKQFKTFVGKNCFYCNSKLPWLEFFTRNIKRENHGYNLDRKDSTKGYSLENCVACCSICNWTKSALFTFDEFIIIGKSIKKVLKNRIKKKGLQWAR